MTLILPPDTISPMRMQFLTLALAASLAAEPVQLSGIYPHLAMFNDEGECGTGAVVPWAGRHPRKRNPGLCCGIPLG